MYYENHVKDTDQHVLLKYDTKHQLMPFNHHTHLICDVHLYCHLCSHCPGGFSLKLSDMSFGRNLTLSFSFVTLS